MTDGGAASSLRVTRKRGVVVVVALVYTDLLPWRRIAVATEVNITERKLGGGVVGEWVGGGESRNDCMK